MKRHFRLFSSRDLQGCLELFRSNVPEFFAPHEETDFLNFLRNLHTPYYVLEGETGEMLACGGFALDARLCWGMVSRSRHRRGLGKMLLLHRLQAMYEILGPVRAGLTTSQHAAGFFARFGFREIARCPDGLAPGLDRVDMELLLEPSLVQDPPFDRKESF